jgi:ATP-dependent DNA helicase RecG
MPSPPAAFTLDTPLKALGGVGPERSTQLARLELFTVRDLLAHRPLRHEDRRYLKTIRELQPGRAATTRGRVVALGAKTYRKGTKSTFEIVLEDGTGRLHCRWWNLPFMENYFAAGDEVMVFGKLKSLKPRLIDHPETEVIDGGEELSIHVGRVAPVYPSTEGLPQRFLRSLVWRALQRAEAVLAESPLPELPDLPGHAQAVRWLHFPDEPGQETVARQRLALEEFVALQLEFLRRRRHLQTHARGLPCAGNNTLIRPFLRQLGFTLTPAQTRVLRELRADLGGPHPMRRLVQGDVGSGKTVVAACAALMTLESGLSVALMAPTEILAGQHEQTFRRWFDPLGVPVELHTGSVKTLARAGAIPKTSSGAAAPPPRLVIGTHALIEARFDLENVGLVIIDEQHKFGVVQRERLVRKGRGRYPHLLVMTATPIPRTLGLTLYGDLDISVIDELPAGRPPVRTFVRGPGQLPKVLAFLRREITGGRQAYVVYPRVEDADAKTGVKAVTAEFERLQRTLAPARVGLLHGRLPPCEKERVMAEFRAHRLDVLVATSVIEVGVDVPNATVMLVENAEQFGLAQLHQLRGRIGRGAHESWCILVAESKTDDARARLKALAETNDGFAIAEADLRLRGPGELLGAAQSGLPRLRFGDFVADRPLVERARPLAAELMDPPEPARA